MQNIQHRNRLIGLVLAAVVSVAVAACNEGQTQPEMAYPPSPVAVVTAKSEALPITNELPGDRKSVV